MLQNGERILQTAIDSAVAAGRRSVRITGEYEISDTVLVPSDFTLYLEDCYLRMADAVAAQMFRNASARCDGTNTAETRDHNIRIIGVGSAVLDGGNYNGLSERNSCKDGRPHISKNNLILFCNVEHFKVENLELRNQRWWAMNFLFCSDGVIRDIDFCANDTWIDADGNVHHGLDRADQEQDYVKNADGIDLRVGCHDILIENITGFTEDDTVALTALNGKLQDMYNVVGADRDLHNIVVRNIRASSFCAIVRLLNQGGPKLYNILIDGVVDASRDCPHMNRGIYGVRIGDNHMYGSRHATALETRNITVTNVYSRGQAAVQLAGAMSELHLSNIYTFDGCTCAVLDERGFRSNLRTSL